MTTSPNLFNEGSATERLSQFINNLSMDEVRILARMLNDWQKRDQRSHPRTPCSIITEYMVENQTHKDLIKNISLGGALRAYAGKAVEFIANLFNTNNYDLSTN